MKLKEYETGEHCFGPILTINGTDYDDIDKKEVRAFINDMLDHDINKESLLYELFKKALEYLQADLVDSDHITCEQCGHPNEYIKWKV